jgi:glucose-6-phosphate dehydrogenase assembly protein OpcA
MAAAAFGSAAAKDPYLLCVRAARVMISATSATLAAAMICWKASAAGASFLGCSRQILKRISGVIAPHLLPNTRHSWWKAAADAFGSAAALKPGHAVGVAEFELDAAIQCDDD